MRRLIRFLAVVLASAAPGLQAADAWPMRTVTLVAPSGPGGTSDIFARMLADRLAKDLGRAVIVENRPGVGTLLGAQAVARARPDGHTLLVGAAALTIGPHLMKDMAIDPVRDFAPVRVIARFPNLLIVPGASTVKSVPDLLARARADPGKLVVSSGGVGISEHLSAELFQSMTRTSLVHVPYKSSAESVTAVVSGDAQLSFANMLAAVPAVKAGRVRPIAVTGPARSPFLPDVPTVAEAGVAGFEVLTWFGLLAPAGTPPAIVRRLDESVAHWLQMPETQERLRAMGAEPSNEGPEAFATRIRTESTKWAALIREAKLRAD
jgi:tripartite-type tricarboxylate transporter receptor subunit TctC